MDGCVRRGGGAWVPGSDNRAGSSRALSALRFQGLAESRALLPLGPRGSCDIPFELGDTGMPLCFDADLYLIRSETMQQNPSPEVEDRVDFDTHPQE